MSRVLVAVIAIAVTSLFSGQALGQDGNDDLIEQAAAMFGYTNLSNEQWKQIETATEQILEGVRSSRYSLNMTQAVAIAYIGLVLQNRPSGVAGEQDDDTSEGNVCPALAESVYAFAEFGNNDRNFSLWLKMSMRDDVDDMLEDIKREAADCGCYEVSDVAVEVKIDTSLTQEKYLEHADAMAEALKSCR